MDDLATRTHEIEAHILELFTQAKSAVEDARRATEIATNARGALRNALRDAATRGFHLDQIYWSCEAQLDKEEKKQ